MWFSTFGSLHKSTRIIIHTFIMTPDVRNFLLIIASRCAAWCSSWDYACILIMITFCSSYARQSGAWAYTIARLAALEAEDRLIHA